MPAGTAAGVSPRALGFPCPRVRGLEHLIPVRGVAGSDGAFHQNAGKVGDAEGPVVGDLLHTGPLLGNHVGEL